MAVRMTGMIVGGKNGACEILIQYDGKVRNFLKAHMGEAVEIILITKEELRSIEENRVLSEDLRPRHLLFENIALVATRIASAIKSDWKGFVTAGISEKEP